ncbi:MAG: SDR family oxidoreductase [Campylobacterota bacterium]|nr:SDR family oxidoreductase [Campylobacterota bacterium]
MIYIICALKSEASAIISHFKLTKESLNIYTSPEIKLFITGVGSKNIFINLSAFFATHNLNSSDKIFNIGICAAPKSYDIGQLCIISKINSTKIKDSGEELISFNEPQNTTCNALADMEASSIHSVVSHFVNPDALHVIKIVSDHFEPEIIDKNYVYGLINKKIVDIEKLLNIEKTTLHVAVVTGASSGIGKAIALRLLALGYEVYAISRTSTIKHKNYKHISCDLRDRSTCNALEVKSVALLVNCAGVGEFEPLESMSAENISNMIDVNLKAPLILSAKFLKDIKLNEGHIININSIEATRSSKFASVYSATKSALRAFGDSLYEEVRKSGVSVVNINPDMTKTPFFDKLHFEPHSDEQKHLKAEDIADVVENILRHRDGVSVREVTLRSKKFGILKK